MKIKSPLRGTVKSLESLKDGVFSAGFMGDGVIIEPNDNIVRSPYKGKIVVAFPTGHAYGIEGRDGTNILIHIGVDTVNLNGEGFKRLVEVGDKVKAGQPLVRVDFEQIKNKVPSISVIAIITEDSKTKIVEKNININVETSDIIMITK